MRSSPSPERRGGQGVRTHNKTHNTGCSRRKSPTPEVSVRLRLHSVGTAGFECNGPHGGAVVLSALTTHHKTELATIGNYGPANITANIFSECECSRQINRAFDADRLPPPSRSRLTSDGA